MSAKLNWKYCECGCKGCSLTVAGRHFSYYWDLKDKYYFCEGHHARTYHTKVFDSHEELNDHVTKILQNDWSEMVHLFEKPGEAEDRRVHREDRLRDQGFEDLTGDDRKVRLALNTALKNWPQTPRGK